MMTIHDIVQVGVGMPGRESFETFARDILAFPIDIQSPEFELG